MSIRFFSKSSIRTGEKYSNAWDKTLSRDYELISTTLITSNTTSVTFSNLGDYSSTYKHLQLRVTTRNTRAVNSNAESMRFNGDTGSNYWNHGMQGDGSSVSSYGNSGNTFEPIMGAGSTAASNVFGASIVDILDPFNANKNTVARGFGGSVTDTNRIGIRTGLWLNTASITSITILGNAGDFVSGSRFSLYGIRG